MESLTLSTPDGRLYHRSRVPATVKQRTSKLPTPVWSADHLWHGDLPFDEPAGNLLTCTFYAQAEVGGSSTEILDTAKLYTAMTADGVFEREGVDPESMHRLQVYATGLTYVDQVLPDLMEILPSEDKVALGQFLADLAAQSAIPDADSPDNEKGDFPLLVHNPFAEKDTQSLMFDCRIGREVYHPEAGVSYPGLLRAMKAYVWLRENELREQCVLHTIQPEVGKALLFTREGTLHRAAPGDADRLIYLDALVAEAARPAPN